MKLLLVEDDGNIARNLKKILVTKGYSVDWIADGEEARIRILLYHAEYDVVILDLTLPGMDGMTLVKTLREHDISVPVIITSGHGDMERKIELLNSGADDYLVKPYSVDELIARIASVARRPTAQQRIVHSAGDVSIDTATRRAHVGSREVALTLKEYSLLECFMRRPDEVFSREELSSRVWDSNAQTPSNVLDVHMKNLRKKILSHNSSTHFETVRGIGYRFVT